MKKQIKPICFVFGTRPEIIKISSVIRECVRTKTPFITLHTGQHYSKNMDAIFWKELNLPALDYNLHTGSGTHVAQALKMMEGIEKILMRKKPRFVLVQGDTNSVLAGALVAVKSQIPIAHIEAGLRSYDRTMPEEVNRILTGSVATLHFAPTIDAKKNLLKEGIEKSKIFVTGNTVVDALFQSLKIAQKKSKILKKLKIEKKDFILTTVHRPDNTDSKLNLSNIIDALGEISLKYKMPIIWPIHPRTKKQIEHFNLSNRLKKIKDLILIEPVGFFDMLILQSKSKLIITDSGGIQEEACILKVPCVTLRYNTERPESVSVKANILAGNNPKDIMKAVDKMLNSKRNWKNPFGDDKASQRIIKAINNYKD